MPFGNMIHQSNSALLIKLVQNIDLFICSLFSGNSLVIDIAISQRFICDVSYTDTWRTTESTSTGHRHGNRVFQAILQQVNLVIFGIVYVLVAYIHGHLGFLMKIILQLRG